MVAAVFREDYCRFGYAFPHLPPKEEEDERRRELLRAPSPQDEDSSSDDGGAAGQQDDALLVRSHAAALEMLRALAPERRASWCSQFPAPEPRWVLPASGQ